MFGEDGEDNKKQETGHKKSLKSTDHRPKTAFYSRSKVERSIILLAGVTMNFLLGVLVISFLFTQGVVVPTDKVMVQEILPKTPAFYAGIKVNDHIKSINGETVKTPQDLISLTKKSAGMASVLLVNRCSETKIGSEQKLKSCKDLTISIIPREIYLKEEGSMGIAITNLEIKKYSIIEAPFYGTIETAKTSWYILKGVVNVLWQLVTQARVPEEVAGPIGIYKVTGQALEMGGIMGVFQLLGLLSLNLAVVNLLPIPALDGGRFFLILVEALIGRKKTEKLEKASQSVGLVIIVLLIVLMTANDISRLDTFKNLVQSLKHVF